MKIDKAIELLQAIVLTGEYEGDPDDSDAIKLGIEALLAIQRHRHTLMLAQYIVLKG